MSDDARRPTLARRARLRWDAARAQHVVVVPEGVLALSAEGAEVAALLDGRRSVTAVIDALAPSAAAIVAAVETVKPPSTENVPAESVTELLTFTEPLV